MGRGTRRLTLVVGVLTACAGFTVACGSAREPSEPSTGGNRFAARWAMIELSPDRRTVTVQAGYPLEGFCVKEPAGIDVTVDGTTARVAVWMQGPSDVDDDSMCSAECGLVPQRLELDEPLPEDVVAFEPVAVAVATCWTDPAPPLAVSTTTSG